MMAHSPDTFPEIDTPRLRLRELTPGDVDALFAIHSDADAMRWFGSDPLSSPDEAAKLIEVFASWRLQPNPGTRWAIERKADARLIGTCGLFKWNRAWRSCTVGYELARDAQGAGYMVEALHAALAWGFEHMALNRVEAFIHPRNAASQGLAKKLGFICEGRMREAGYWNGCAQDLDLFSLLPGDRAALTR